MKITGAKLKSFSHKWASNILWLLFKYNHFKKYCSDTFGIEGLNPYGWYHWHDGARCFTAILKNNGQPVFIKTDETFHLVENEDRMSRKFSNGLPKSCPRIEISDLNGPIKLLVYEYIKGRTLDDYLSMPCADVDWPYFYNELLKILDNLYRLNMIHRDITPSNILIQSYSNNSFMRIVLIDFAFAVIAGETCIDSQYDKSKVTHLGLGLNPKPYFWDDAHSSLQILKRIEECSGRLYPSWRDKIEKRVGRITHTIC